MDNCVLTVYQLIAKLFSIKDLKKNISTGKFSRPFAAKISTPFAITIERRKGKRICWIRGLFHEAHSSLNVQSGVGAFRIVQTIITAYFV